MNEIYTFTWLVVCIRMKWEIQTFYWSVNHFVATRPIVPPLSFSFWFMLEEHNTQLILILFMPFEAPWQIDMVV